MRGNVRTVSAAATGGSSIRGAWGPTSGTKTVDFEVRWSDRHVAAGLVNRLMDLFRNQVAEVRKAKINGYVEDFKEHVEGCRARLQAANDALTEFSRRERVGDVNADLARLKEILEIQAVPAG